MIGYKLFQVRKDGSLGPIQIHKSQRIEKGKWLTARSYPTKGYKVRPGWHITAVPFAPHLSMKNREWHRVEFKDYYKLEVPKNHGGSWYVAKKMRVIE